MPATTLKREKKLTIIESRAMIFEKEAMVRSLDDAHVGKAETRVLELRMRSFSMRRAVKSVWGVLQDLGRKDKIKKWLERRPCPGPDARDPRLKRDALDAEGDAVADLHIPHPEHRVEDRHCAPASLLIQELPQ